MMSWCSSIGSKPPPFFFLPFFGRATFVVSWCAGSSACSLGGRLLALMISSIVCFTDTSGYLDAITGVSGSLFVICGIRLRVGGGGGGTGVLSRTPSPNRVLTLLTGTGVSCASVRTSLLNRRLGCLRLRTGVSSITPFLNRGFAL